MDISKKKLETLLNEFPEDVDMEEFMYRLYLLKKIEQGEESYQSGQTLSHKETTDRLSAKWRN